MEGRTIANDEVEECKFLVALVPVVHDRSPERQSKHGGICANQSEEASVDGFHGEGMRFYQTQAPLSR